LKYTQDVASTLIAKPTYFINPMAITKTAY